MTRQGERCDEVLASVMATLDGEEAPLGKETIDAHLRGCPECRASATSLAALHGRLMEMTYRGPRIDLWPAIDAGLQADARRKRERVAFVLVAAVCISWRVAELLFELPAPVLNGILPLIVLLVVTRWLAGDPLAIALTTAELRQERA
jgi:predicted anti-sigma-YlaC factor YlaD